MTATNVSAEFMWPVKGTVVSECSKDETDGIKIVATKGDQDI